MLTLIADSFDPSLPQKLTRFGEVTLDKERLAEADVVLVRSKTKCTREYIDRASRLKLIIRGGVGLDNIDCAYADAKGIKVLNTAAASAVAVAEITMTLLLCIPSRVLEGHLSMREGKWLKKELMRDELFGKTLGLIGVGNVGTEVAKRAKAFGMRVVGYDPYVTQRAEAELLPTLDAVLAAADYLSLHVPLTDETKAVVDASAIAKMKDGVVIVNTARAACVVEQDLADALHSGKVHGYATDVWVSDPPPPDSPLFKAPNVVMTPHIGASTRENLLRIGDVIVEIMEREAR
jgi:D-3-phosphoglycerate dehydrogenase